jgi:hypothetical protein
MVTAYFELNLSKLVFDFVDRASSELQGIFWAIFCIDIVVDIRTVGAMFCFPRSRKCKIRYDHFNIVVLVQTTNTVPVPRIK